MSFSVLSPTLPNYKFTIIPHIFFVVKVKTTEPTKSLLFLKPFIFANHSVHFPSGSMLPQSTPAISARNIVNSL